MQKTKILYLSYDGIMEPLGQSQILEYLFELSDEFDIFLISYEKIKGRLALDALKKLKKILKNKNISWMPLVYHRHPAVISTLYDLIKGFSLSACLALRHHIKIVHARSYCAALIAYLLKKTIKTYFIFDMRGFLADERFDAGFWKKSSISYKATKLFEKLFLSSADWIVSLTNSGVNEIRKFTYLSDKKIKIKVISTCTNLDNFILHASNLVSKESCFNLGYAGTVNGWYLFEPVLDSFKILLDLRPNSRLIIFNVGQHKYILDQISKKNLDRDSIILKTVDFSSIPREIGIINAGIFFIKPCFSKKASSPTKLGEFLACGKPCLTNSGVGDMDNILNDQRTGIILEDFTLHSLRAGVDKLLRLTSENDISLRCRNTAAKYFSLKDGVKSYREIYRDLK